MGINQESDVNASLVIGPTSLGMVRIYVETDTMQLPMDFAPDEALEIAEELRAAAERAQAQAQKQGQKQGQTPGQTGNARGKKDKGRS